MRWLGEKSRSSSTARRASATASRGVACVHAGQGEHQAGRDRVRVEVEGALDLGHRLLGPPAREQVHGVEQQHVGVGRIEGEGPAERRARRAGIPADEALLEALRGVGAGEIGIELERHARGLPGARPRLERRHLVPGGEHQVRARHAEMRRGVAGIPGDDAAVEVEGARQILPAAPAPVVARLQIGVVDPRIAVQDAGELRADERGQPQREAVGEGRGELHLHALRVGAGTLEALAPDHRSVAGANQLGAHPEALVAHPRRFP